MDLENLLSREVSVTRREADDLISALTILWNAQSRQMGSPVISTHSLQDTDALHNDLKALRHWFNPIASGKRLRESVEQLAQSTAVVSNAWGNLVEPIDDRRALVTPEGRVAMWLLADAMSTSPGSLDHTVWPSAEQISVAWSTLTRLYRSWNRQRIVNVTGLLREETATLRPSVIGLLLVLLINRNTSFDRRVPNSKDARLSADISATLSVPAIAFANSLSGSKRADARGIDLYRGWAVGEISRRLGAGLRKDSDGLWIEESAVSVAEARIIEALVNRPREHLSDVNIALDAALSAYQNIRPRLTSLGIAHERPSVTARLMENIRAALASAERANS